MKEIKWLVKEDSWANIIGLFLVVSISAFWFFGEFSMIQALNVKFSSWRGSDIMGAFKNLSLLNFVVLF